MLGFKYGALRTPGVCLVCVPCARKRMVDGTQVIASCTGTHGRCYTSDAVLGDVLTCTCTNGRCHACDGVLWGEVYFLALAHLVDATQMMGCCVGRGDVYVPRTCTHGRCYTSDGVCRDVFPCLALAHMVDAAEVMGCCGGGMFTVLALAHLQVDDFLTATQSLSLFCRFAISNTN